MNTRSQHQFTLLQASENNPGLAKLMSQQKESLARLRAIEPLIPPALRSGVKCGPFDEGVWCIMLSNNTTSAKLRQLLPIFEEKLRTSGLTVTSIRLKVSR
ncbi:hypothetical protein [Rhodoferax sp.]|uniref:hypothetical protein n=1 Tax=Rhodoferax sp. TaxID=50421 RepID=UPI00283E96B8|nr:hypothetical protein [Rhodoferax sp.]MDR3369971.1 hypothetical protein [Rhodoferax sp.]